MQMRGRTFCPSGPPKGAPPPNATKRASSRAANRWEQLADVVRGRPTSGNATTTAANGSSANGGRDVRMQINRTHAPLAISTLIKWNTIEKGADNMQITSKWPIDCAPPNDVHEKAGGERPNN
uniref:Uncharacterized protein n=1 Tax=Trichuris muris TaxID=70415 RepID=A0A5S6R322_TRIMR